MFSNPLLAPLFLAVLAAFVATIGLIFVSIRSDWSRKNASLFAIAASGILITTVVLHLLPEAFHGSEIAPFLILGGFFIGLLLNDILKGILPKEQNSQLVTGITPVIAIAIHSFVDGMIYTVTFAHTIESGFLTAIGLIAHELPEGIVAFALLRGAGISNRNSFLYAFLATALTTPLGTLTSFPFMMVFPESTLSILFAISAGLLLFVATGPLMSHMRDESPGRALPAVALGVGVALIAVFSSALSHSHDHHSDEDVLEMPHEGHDHHDDGDDHEHGHDH